MTMNTEQERAELLPCPFCGAGTTEIQDNGRPWLGTRWGEPVSVSVRHWCDHVDGQPSRMIERVGRDRAAAIDAWNRRAALQSQEYTAAIGESGQAYLDRFKNAHALPAEFRWSELWAVMCVAANKGRTDALQSQDREDAGMAEIVREAAQIIAAISPEHAPDNIRWPIVDELEGFASKIDHARRVEGES